MLAVLFPALSRGRVAAIALVGFCSSRRVSCFSVSAPSRMDSTELDDPSHPIRTSSVTVSPRWLHGNLGKVALLDASWHMPAAKRDSYAEYCTRRLPTSTFFDIDRVADRRSSLPHMLPPVAEFAAAMRALGVRKDSPVVVYDSVGVFSAPRAWWTLRTFGHRSVAILNGGLPRWAAERLPVVEGEAATSCASAASPSPAEVCAAADAAAAAAGASAPTDGWALDSAGVRDLDAILRNIEAASAGAGTGAASELVVDARGAPRFVGEAPEPRAGVRKGHMPHSVNVPFNDVLDAAKHSTFLPAERLRAVFEGAGVPVAVEGGAGAGGADRTVVLSCGSGITASVLYAALALAGRPTSKLALYDGSWTEYGASPRAPVLVGRPGAEKPSEEPLPSA